MTHELSCLKWSSYLVCSKWQEVANDDQLKAAVDHTPPNNLTYIYSAGTNDFTYAQ